MRFQRITISLMASLVLAITVSTSVNAQTNDRQAMMDLVIQVQQLQDEVRMLRGMLEEQAMELENLVDLAVATVKSALERKESRGAHSRIDYPERDDVSWLKHSLYYKEGHRMDYKPVTLKPVTVDSFPPKPRVY